MSCARCYELGVCQGSGGCTGEALPREAVQPTLIARSVLPKPGDRWEFKGRTRIVTRVVPSSLYGARVHWVGKTRSLGSHTWLAGWNDWARRATFLGGDS